MAHWDREKLITFLSICIIHCTEGGFINGTVQVTTTKGRIQGLEVLSGAYNETVYQFLGIPYAKPPIGKLRFEKPVDLDPWVGVVNATRFGPSCIQNFLGNDLKYIPNKNQSEDCLLLNIYVPHEMKQSSPKSVMIWIHGGGFVAGQGMMYDGSALALFGDVIVVTLNYRLGIFGFLSSGDRNYPGNYGMWDQHKAIQWVKHNIARFGGDPNSLTIFGESAGSMAVGLHLFYPHNKGLFQRAISQSGAPMSLFGNYNNMVATTWKTAKSLRCTEIEELPNILPTAVIECFRSRSFEQLLAAANAASADENLSFKLHFTPVVDGDFIPDTPENIIQASDSEGLSVFSETDYMLGVNSKEGGLLYITLKSKEEITGIDPDQIISKEEACKTIYPAIMRDRAGVQSPKLIEALCNRYNGTDQRNFATDVYSDVAFVGPTIKTAIEHSRQGTSKTYQYLFSHEPQHGFIEFRPAWLNGANHADEIFFVFGLEQFYGVNNYTVGWDEKYISRQMMAYWAEFAKSGNLHQDHADVPPWQEFDDMGRMYKKFGDSMTDQCHMYGTRMEFWIEEATGIIVAEAEKFHSHAQSINNVQRLTLTALIVCLCHYFILDI